MKELKEILKNAYKPAIGLIIFHLGDMFLENLTDIMSDEFIQEKLGKISFLMLGFYISRLLNTRLSLTIWDHLFIGAFLTIITLLNL